MISDETRNRFADDLAAYLQWRNVCQLQPDMHLDETGFDEFAGWVFDYLTNEGLDPVRWSNPAG